MRERLLSRPSKTEPSRNCTVGNARAFGPRRHAKRLATECDQAISSGVAPLLNGGGPPAVARIVIAGVVTSLNRVFRGRPLSHVGEEVGETASPAFADSNAPSPVSAITGSARVVTALDHAHPSSEFDGFHPAYRSAMRRMTGRRNLAVQAAAALREASQKVASGTAFSAAADAQAFPPGLSHPIAGANVVRTSADHRKSSERLPRHVDQSRHRYVSTSPGEQCRALSPETEGAGGHPARGICIVPRFVGWSHA